MAAAAPSSHFRLGDPAAHGSRFAISGAAVRASTSGVLRVSVCRAVCHSPLLTSSRTASRPPPPPSVDFSPARWKFMFSFLTEKDRPAVDEQEERNGVGVGMNWETLLPWKIIPPARDAEEAREARDTSGLPSLAHANVMWFKGPYNAEIECGVDEPAESIVRRFRGAVLRAGVISECHRRRYRETRQDTVKRKRIAALRSRRRRPTFGARAWTDNTWRLSREHLRPVDYSKNKRKKKLRNFRKPPNFDDKCIGPDEKHAADIDDGNWDYPVEDEIPSR